MSPVDLVADTQRLPGSTGEALRNAQRPGSQDGIMSIAAARVSTRSRGGGQISPAITCVCLQGCLWVLWGQVPIRST
jgi:hypothetical protein